MSKQPGKDVIYIDVDDEITAIIDKVRSARERIVALVLPKRATVLQSVINMKLLKRTTDGAKKHMVLITTESSLLPLAGAVGIHVAKSLQSKPEIPHITHDGEAADNSEESVDMNDTDDTKLDKSRPVGEYAAAGAAADDEDQAIELDNSEAAVATQTVAGKKPKVKKDKKLAIPDFNKFRLKLLLGGTGVVAVLVFLYVGLAVMPRATVVVKTDSSAIDTNIDLTFNTEAEEVDEDANVLPAKSVQIQKVANQQVDATGQKDKGEKASGQVTLSLQDCSKTEVTIPAGTGVTSGGLTFITKQSTTLNSVKVGSQCKNSSFPSFSSDTVAVTAQGAGEKYNVEATSYTVAGFSNVAGSGTKMTGGTSDIVKVVSQADIDNAKQKISAQDNTATKVELKEQLTSQTLYAVEETFSTSATEVSASASVGAEVATVSVTQKTTYTMLGVQENDLKKVIENEVNKHIDPNKQAILDYGLPTATFKLQNQQGSTTLVTLASASITGSDLSAEDLKKQVAGKKAGEAKDIIGRYPGVTSVDVRYSPFWVSSIPKKTDKITVTVEKPAVKNVKQ